MMLAVLVRREAKMATGLADDHVPKITKRLSEIASATDRGEPSYGDDFLTDMVKTDDLRRLPFLEVTTDRITNLAGQLGERVCLCENGFSERACEEPTLRSLFDHEDQFTHRHPLIMNERPVLHILVSSLRNVQILLDSLERIERRFCAHFSHIVPDT